MRRVASVSLATLVVLFAGRWPSSAQTGNASVVEVGWWTASATADAPDGGFVVGGRLDGPHSVAAIRVDVGDGVTELALHALEAGGTGADVAEIQACPIDGEWVASAGEPLAEAPEMDCAPSRASMFIRDAESGTWSADVTGMAGGRSGAVSIGIAPVPFNPANLASAVGFELAFEPPTATAIPRAAPPSTSVAPTTTAPALVVPSTTVFAAPAPSPTIHQATTTTTFVAAAPPAPRNAVSDERGGTNWADVPALALIAVAVGSVVGGASKVATQRAARLTRTVQ